MEVVEAVPSEAAPAARRWSAGLWTLVSSAYWRVVKHFACDQDDDWLMNLRGRIDPCPPKNRYVDIEAELVDDALADKGWWN